MSRTHLESRAQDPDVRAALLRRNTFLEAAAELVRVTGSHRDLKDLLTMAARFLRERLDLSFAGLFTLDEPGTHAVLRAGAGEVGHALIQQGYQISLSEDSALTRALSAERPILLRHGINTDLLYARLLLPVTPGAAVVPLKGRGGMLGFWTAHTSSADAFDTADADVLALIGDNLASAIENAQLFGQVNPAVSDKNRSGRDFVTADWSKPAVTTQVVYSQQEDAFTTGAGEAQSGSVGLPEGAGAAGVMSVPISLRGQVIGTVDLYDITQPRHWGDNEQALVSGVVEQLALALDNARLYKETEQRARETQIINEMASAISGELDARRLYETVYRYLPRLMPTDAFMVWLYDDQTNKVTRPALYDLGEYYPDDEGPRAPSGSVKQVVESRSPVVVNNTRQAWERERQENLLILGSSDPSASRLYVPLRVGNRLRGILSVQTYEFDAYGAPQMALLTSVANTVATALENAQLFAETNSLFNQAQQALAETRLLYSTSGRLNQVTSLEELVRIAAQPAFAQGAGSAQLLLMENQGQPTPAAANVVVSLVSPGVPAALSPYTHFALAEYPIGQSILANPRDLVVIEDVAENAALDKATRQVLNRSQDRAVVLMPLSVEQRVLGAIVIGWSMPHRLSDQERRIYQSLAGQLALVLNNLLLFEQTEQALAETQTLYEISARLNAANSLQESLEAASGPAIMQGATTASLYQPSLDPQGKLLALEMVARWPRNVKSEVDTAGTPAHRENDRNPAWFENPRDPLLIENVLADGQTLSAEQQVHAANPVASSALLPLKLGDRWVGLLTFDWQEPHSFSARDVRLFRAIMAQAATVLDNRALFEQSQAALAQVRQQNTFLTALHDTALGLMRRLNLDELLQNIISRAAELVGTEHGYVHLVEPNGTELRMRVGIGVYQDFVGAIVKPGQGLAGTVWSEQHAIVVDDYRFWPGRLPMVDRDVLRAVAGVPLKSANQTVGVLGLASLEEGRRFGAAQVEALERFAALAAVALDNAQLINATQQALEQTQRAAQREKASSDIADKLYAAPDVKTVLRTAAEELRKSTGSRRAIVRLNPGFENSELYGNGKSGPNDK